MLNVYGKEASAYYDLFGGLRHLKRGETMSRPVKVEQNDTIREELEEFAHCIRTGTKPETDGWWAARNLAVVKAGIKSARERRVVDIVESSPAANSGRARGRRCCRRRPPALLAAFPVIRRSPMACRSTSAR